MANEIAKHHAAIATSATMPRGARGNGTRKEIKQSVILLKIVCVCCIGSISDVCLRRGGRGVSVSTPRGGTPTREFDSERMRQERDGNEKIVTRGWNERRKMLSKDNGFKKTKRKRAGLAAIQFSQWKNHPKSTSNVLALPGLLLSSAMPAAPGASERLCLTRSSRKSFPCLTQFSHSHWSFSASPGKRQGAGA